MSTSSQRPGASTTNSLTTDNLQYPDTIGQKVAAGQHYMLLESYESKNSLNRVGGSDATAKSSIALYIPAGGLTTTTAQSYEEIDGGALFAQSGSAAIDKFAIGEIGAAGMLTAGGVGIARGIANLKRGVLSKLGGGFVQAGLGLAVNNHLSVGYKGPSGFRDHSFAFKFFPKNSSESDTVKAILKDFHNGSTPRMTESYTAGGVSASAFFKSPRHWTIKFLTNGSPNKYLHEIKTSVITQMQTNYDPISMVSFHQDGSPVQIDLNLTFKEISLVTSEDEAGEGPDIEAGMAAEAATERAAVSNIKYNSVPGGSKIQ